MQPVNYLGLMPQQNFLADIQSGLQFGMQLRQIQDAQAKAEAQRQAQLQYQTDIQAAMASPSPQAFAKLALQYPQHREAYKDAWGALSAEQQTNELRDTGQVIAALGSDRPDVAEKLVRDRLEVKQKSGQPVDGEQMLLDLIRKDPKQAYAATLNVASALPGGDKLLENLGRVQTTRKSAAEATTAEATAAVAPQVAQAGAVKAAADATTAQVTAKYAESNALKDLEIKGWNVQQIQADIDYKRQSTRIAAMQAALAKEGNDLKRQELQMKIDDAKRKVESDAREKVAEAQSAATAIDNMLNTIERVKKNPRLNDVVGGIEGRMPGIRDDSVDAIALIDQLGSQAFIAQIPAIKGTGNLSNAEGDKLQAALQNLSRAQSEGQFRSSLDEAARLLMKARSTAEKKYGVPLGKPDTPAAPGARPPLASFER